MTQSHSCSRSPELFIIALSYSLHHDPKSFIASRALSSRPRAICIIHILEMLRFHHFSHLWVASTWHHEPESILIGYPFTALSSRPNVVLLIYDPKSFFPFRALSSWPRVILLICDPESFLFHLEPRAHDPESFFLFMNYSHSFHLEPQAHNLESFFLFMS